MGSVHKIEAQGGMQIPVVSSDPSVPEDGTIWYNSSDNLFKKREDGTTTPLTASEVFDTETLVDGSTDAVLLTYPDTFLASMIKYQILRDGNVQVGTLIIANNTIQANIIDDFVNTNDIGIFFSADIDSGNVRVLYTTTLTGFDADFKFSISKW